MSRQRPHSRQRKPVFREGSKEVYDFEKLIGHDGDDIYFHVEPPGKGYFHVLTEDEILNRLNELPERLLPRLKCVVLPTMTRKRKRINVYGMQWDQTIYLYPMTTDLRVGDAHHLYPADVAEARQFGATIEDSKHGPIVQWAPETIKLFYLENILIHELGHIVDVKNVSTKDREAYAEWFARKHGRWPKRERKRWVKPVQNAE